MLAVERALDRSLERRCLKILREHRRPRHRLKREPMRARRRQHGNYHQHLAKFAEHVRNMMKRFVAVNYFPSDAP